MTKTGRLLALVCALAVFAVLSAPMVEADSLNFSGGMTFAPAGGGESITFSGLTVTNTSTGTSDTVVGQAVAIPDAIDLVGVSGGNGVFNPDSGTISLGNSTIGTLNGTITFAGLTSNGSGGFELAVDLSNLSITGGTSNILSAWTGNQAGGGIMTFQFFDAGVDSVSDLLDASPVYTSVSGSIATPEPSSFVLLGLGLIGVFLFRNRPGLAAQSLVQ